MTTSKVTVIIAVVGLILILGIPTTYKVIKNHNNTLTKVVEDKIQNAAKKCYYEEVCTEDIVTLEFLYEHKYLEEVSNPITKEYYNSKSYVKINDNYKFIVVE